MTEQASMVECTDGFEWINRINCADLTIDDFVPSRGQRIAPRVIDRCHTCPVRRECLVSSKDLGQTSVWRAGFSPEELRLRTVGQLLDRIDQE